MRKFAHAAVTAAGAAGLLTMTVLASAYISGPTALAAPAGTRAGTLARIRPGGPMTAPGNRSPARRAFSGNTVNLVSGNWADYVAQRQGVRFRYVRAAFFVPYIDCASAPSSFSGHWVGLDGQGNATVEQDGILAACQGSAPVYSAWYEMFPLPPVYSAITVRRATRSSPAPTTTRAPASSR
jgi:Peptidase A4 family